jgi:DNA-binding MarR family transcriptional regulator
MRRGACRATRDSRNILAQHGRTEEGLGLGRDIAPEAGDDRSDAASVEADITRLWARWESAIAELGGAIPASQQRALLIVDDCGTLSPTRLAAALGTALPGITSMCDRMVAAGLLRCEQAAGTCREITLGTTAAGQRLARWIRGRRRAVLAHDLGSMSADGRRALARGLGELGRLRPDQDAGGARRRLGPC